MVFRLARLRWTADERWQEPESDIRSRCGLEQAIAAPVLPSPGTLENADVEPSADVERLVRAGAPARAARLGSPGRDRAAHDAARGARRAQPIRSTPHDDGKRRH